MEELQNEEIVEQSTEDGRWCVYMHINKHNNKVYIGITNDIKQRWQNQGSKYKAKNKDGIYRQPVFADALDKYPDWYNDWIHQVVVEHLTHQEACKKEVELIALYHSNVSRWHDEANGYNMTDGGDGSAGYSYPEEVKAKMSIKAKERFANPENCYWKGKNRSQETKDKISQKNKGRLSGENNPNYGRRNPNGPQKSSLAVVQYDLNGYKITTYPSTFYAQKATGILCSNIRDCCINTYKTIGGYMWRFLKDCNEDKIEPYKNTTVKSVVQLNLSGELIAIYESIKEASQATRVLKSGIIRCCQGKHKKAGDFSWMYKEDYEKQLNDNKLKGEN